MDREQKMLLKEIMDYSFALVETALYLDTHPYDEEALKLHNGFSQKYSQLVSLYQAKYGPLKNNQMSGCPWAYINGPWPWEIDFDL
ncbi:MAG: spore coat protein CotJB [Tissierellia bacterium]|nr:spore coat protein CotJB [Tissierellia bacterium]